MAVEKYVNGSNLARFKSDYDTVIANAIATAVATKIAKIASAAGSKIAITTATGEVSESGTSIADLATNAYVGAIPQSASATTIVGYINEVVEDIMADLGGVLKFKGVVATVADLPASGNENGDVYHVTAASAEYVWLEPEGATGAWEELGSVIDLSDYSTTTQMNAAIAAAIQTAVEALDSSASQTAGSDGLALSVTIVDGAVTAISGSIAPNTYDAYGAASTAAAGVVGSSGDGASANTVHGAKAYADSLGSNYATSAQGALADTALQPSDIEPLTDAEVDAIFTNS